MHTTCKSNCGANPARKQFHSALRIEFLCAANINLRNVKLQIYYSTTSNCNSYYSMIKPCTNYKSKKRKTGTITQKVQHVQALHRHAIWDMARQAELSCMSSRWSQRLHQSAIFFQQATLLHANLAAWQPNCFDWLVDEYVRPNCISFGQKEGSTS